MRILLLYPYLPAPRIAHGSARLVHALLRELGARTEVHLVCAHRPGEAEHLPEVREAVASLHSVERAFASEMRRTTRQGERVSTARQLVTTGFPTAVIKLRRRGLRHAIRDAVARVAPDVVAVELAVMAQHVDLFPGSPSLLVDHEAGGHGLAQGRRWKRYVRRVYPLFDRVAALSEEDASDLAELLEERPEVRPVGLDFAEARPRRPEAGRLLFFGSADHGPNREALAWLVSDLLPGIRKRGLEAHLAIAGFPAEDPLCEQARAAGAETLGFVEDLGAELARAALVVSPVRSGRGVRIKNLEALAAGCPLITTPLGAQGLALQPGVHGELAEGARSWLDALAKLLVAPRRAEAMGRAAADWVRGRHSVTAQAERMLELCQGAIDRHHHYRRA